MEQSLSGIERITKCVEYPERVLPHLEGEAELNDREIEALEMAIQGADTSDVADAMGVSYNTASSYFKGISRKTGLGKGDLAPWIISMIREAVKDA